MKVASTLGFAAAPTCLVYVSTAQRPCEGDWRQYIEFVATHRHRVRKGLVLENGRGPNAAQRKALVDVLGDLEVLTAVVMKDPLTRGVVTALSWFKRGFATFRPDEVDRALAWLQLGSDEAKEVLALASALQRLLASR